MKPRKNRFIISAASALLLAPGVFAADSDGTWNTTVIPSSWSLDTNWASNTIADGVGFTAYFNAVDIPADTTVNLDGARTIGNLIFSDTDPASAGSWTIATGTSGPLTLAGTTPTITVSGLGANKVATITARVAGTDGFTKTGTGSLLLTGAASPSLNTIIGQINVNQGILQLNANGLADPGANVAINTGATLVLATSSNTAVGGTISFNGGTFRQGIGNPSGDYSNRFSTASNQNYTIDLVGATTVSFGTALSSVGGTLYKLGNGALTLAVANTFNGTTRVAAGKLILGNALALQNSALDTTNSVTGTTTAGLELSGVTTPTFGGLTGSKALLSVFDTDSGNYGSVTNVTLNPGTGSSPSYSGAIADGAAGMTLTKTGDGTQALTVANSYSGGTNIAGGTLAYGNVGALGAGDVTFTGSATLQANTAGTLANAIAVNSGMTGTFNTNNNSVTLSGPLTGSGNFTKSGTNSLTLAGGVSNNLAGSINVNAGTLNIVDGQSLTGMPGTITVASGASFNYSKNFGSGNNLPNTLILSGAGAGGTSGALNLWGNVTATGPITLAADATISHDWNNATISNSITGTDRNLTLKTTQSAQAGLLISASIQLGTGGITVASAGGTNIVTLSGNNSYSGETRVQTGTLKLTGSATINDSSTVRIDSGAFLHLDFAGTDTVAALYFGGDPNPKPNGTYGSLTSLADNKSADFLGDGILQVGAAANNYASWASSQAPPVTGGENGDDNNNGVKNLVEYALANGGERGVLSGNTITFTKRGAPYGGDLTYIIETSETLAGSWTPAVTHGPAQLGSPISYDLAPVPGTPKKFARLKVVNTP